MAGFGLKSRQITITDTNVAQPLATSSQQGWCQQFVLKAKSTNAANIYIGDSTVDNTGFAVPAGAILSTYDLSGGIAREQLSLTQIYIYGQSGDIVELLHEKTL